MLSCNVAAYEGDDGRAEVSTIAPFQAMANLGPPAMLALAEKVSAHLSPAFDTP